MNTPPSHGSAAERIRAPLQTVQALRIAPLSDAQLTALRRVKRVQSWRFAASYADFRQDPRHAAATRFFLDELYGDRDFGDRDAQFGRIAGAIERLFPPDVAALAADLAETHALTETLDHAMAGHWPGDAGDDPVSLAQAYRTAWQRTAATESRQRQLDVVLHMGRELQRLTRLRSLRLALRWMRQPAELAGLGALQRFLERGFEAFAAMGDARVFLAAIAEREQAWIGRLFDPTDEGCTALLAQHLIQGRGLSP